jgi:hypothetical protein
VIFVALQALGAMTDHEAAPTTDVLDALVAQLLACGGPLSQMISNMHEFEASGLAAPDTPPVLEVAHSLIRSVVGEVRQRHTDDEIRTSAEIVEEVTNAICENIFIVPPDEIRRARHRPPPAARKRTKPRGRVNKRR